MTTKLKFLKQFYTTLWDGKKIDFFKKPQGTDEPSKNIHYDVTTNNVFNNGNEVVNKNTAYYDSTSLTTTPVDTIYNTAVAPKQSIPFNRKIDSFIIKVKTDNPGTTTSTQFLLPLNPACTYNCIIEWGDGTTTYQTTTTSPTHTYPQAGTYTISIKGVFGAIYFNIANDRRKLVSIENWGSGVWQSFQNAFYGCNNVVGNFKDMPDTSQVTNLALMFAECDLFNSPVPIFLNCPLVTTTNLMFYRTALDVPVTLITSPLLLNISQMFQQCVKFNQPILLTDTSSVTAMNNLFLTSGLFNQSLAWLNTRSVTNCQFMFSSATAFKQPITNFNPTNFTTVSNFSYNGPFLTELYLAWSKYPVQPNLSFNFGVTNKYRAEAIAARAILTSAPNNWTIVDGGVG